MIEIIIDGVDITNEFEISGIRLEAFSSDPENPSLPFFKLEYNVIETDPLNPKEIKTSIKKIIVLPDDAGAMQRSSG